MKLIKPYFEIIEQKPDIKGLYKQVELCGRVAYKSEDKITEDSYKGFVDRMIKLNHGAVLEHGTVYLKIPAGLYEFLDYNNYRYDDIKDSIFANPYTKIHCQNGYYYISTNYRVLIENFAQEFIQELLQYICEPTEYHEKRICVRFVCDRGVSHEFVRHRTFSFLMESTRYCNYSKNKFNNEVTFIIPNWLDLTSSDDEIHIDGNEGEYCYSDDIYTSNFLYTLRYAERIYLDLIKQWDKKIPDKRYKSGFKNNPWTPQEARAVLPNALKTELIMTGFVSDWKHFFKLRDAGSAHPQAQELAKPLHEEFIRRNYVNE